MLVQATDAIKPILESGSLVSGISLFDEGSLIHFSPIPASVIQQWQDMLRSDDRILNDWLKGHDIFQSLSKDKDYLIFFFCRLHANGPLSGATFLCQGPLSTEAITCVYGFDMQYRDRDNKGKLWPTKFIDHINQHYNVLKDRPQIALSENFGNIPRFIAAFADAYRFRNFRTIQRARQYKGQPKEGFGSPPVTFTIGGINYVHNSPFKFIYRFSKFSSFV